MFNFWGNPELCPKWLHHFTLTAQCIRVLVSLYPHQNLSKFYSSHPSGCQVVSHLVYISLMTYDVKHLFNIDHSNCPMYSFLKNFFQNSLLIFNLSCLFIVRFWEFFICSGYQAFIRCAVCKYLLLSCGLSFQLFFLQCPLKHKSLFWWSPIFYSFFFIFLVMLMVSYLRNYCLI